MAAYTTRQRSRQSGVFLAVLVIFAAVVPQACGAFIPGLYPPSRSWRGWAGVKNVFVFGDSWSDTGFDSSGPQPRLGAPLGNPILPTLNVSQGAEWPVYLTTQYNNSMVETYVLAKASSIVNSSFESWRPDLIHQVQEDFLPFYGNRNSSKWQPFNTLFIIFIGINDVDVSLNQTISVSETFDQIMVTYSALVDQLYQTGAQNFLFMNVPPLELAPAAGLAVGPAVLDWNARVSKLASNLSSTYNDTTVFRFDTYKLFTQVLSNVNSYPTSSQFKNTTASCVPYDWSYVDMFDPSCGVPLREYVWMNNLHPTYPMHQTIASQIPKALDGAYGWHPYRRG